MDKIALHGAEKFYFQKRAVRIVSLALALVLAVIFSFALGMDFEPTHALFESGSVLGQIAFYTALVFAAVPYVLTLILVKKETQDESAFPAENEYITYYKLDNAFIKTYRIILAVLIAVEGFVNAVYDGVSGSSFFVMIFKLLLSLVLALYFIPELTERLGSTRLHLGCGIIGILWFAVEVFTSYFDRTYPLASKYIILSQVSYILMMLAITYELSYRFSGTHIRARLASAASAFVLSFGFGVGKLFMLMSSGQVNAGDTAVSFIMLALSVYFGARIFFYSED